MAPSAPTGPRFPTVSHSPWRLAWLAAALAGCPDDPGSTPDATAPVDVTRDVPNEGADAAPRPPLDPRLFDCTAPGPPVRASAVSPSCALDRGCLTPQIAGHRGAGGSLGTIAPEDSLAAYRAAIALGIEFVETDPRPTADGVIVNLHDTDVDRTTDGHGTVSSMTFAQVRALHLRAERYAGDYSCERIPTLREILELCRGRVVVLVDANKTDRVDLLVQAIHDADAREWAVFDTSDLGKIERALAMDPALHFQIRPERMEDIEPQMRRFARLPDLVEINRGLVREAAPLIHRLGSRVFTDVFGEDALATLRGDTSGYDTVLNDGVDVLQTDRPELVLGVLRARRAR